MITGAETVVVDEIVRVRTTLPVPALLVALNVTVEVPAAVGVPEIKPAELTDKPAGNPVAPKLVGELVAVVWYTKAVPTFPAAVVALVIAGAARVVVDVTVTVTVALTLPAPLKAVRVYEVV